LNLQTPMVIVNFKTYLESTGKKALELAKQAEKHPKKLVPALLWHPNSLTLQKLQKK